MSCVSKNYVVSFILIVFLLTSVFSGVSASDASSCECNDSGLIDTDFLEYKIQTSNHTINVFYNKYCGACHRAIPFVEEVSEKYPEVKVCCYDTYNSPVNRTLLHLMGDQYNNPFPSYPVVFAGEGIILEGAYSINSNFEDVISSVDAGLVPDAEYEKRWTGEDLSKNPASSDSGESKMSIYLVVLAGVADGINPCAFAVLIFLLIALMSAGSTKKVLITGLIYAMAVFVFYVLAGLGILGFVESAGYSNMFLIIAGAVAITAGIISIQDGILKNSLLSLSISDFSKKYIADFLRKSTLPAAFLLGLTVGLFELPCTGGIYLAILSLLSSEMTFYEGIPYLVLYNVMFVMPLLLITAAVAFGISPGAVDVLRERYRKHLKVATGLILILIGIIAIMWQF